MIGILHSNIISKKEFEDKDIKSKLIAGITIIIKTNYNPNSIKSIDFYRIWSLRAFKS